MAEFNTCIDSGLPVVMYMRKQEKCQVFAYNAGVLIFNEMMVTTGSKHPLSTGNMTLGWRKWKRRPAIEHKWANWKTHWTAAFAKMHNIARITTGKTTFGANQAAEIEQAQQMASSLDNLANVSIQKNATIDSLVATNAALSKAIQEIQHTLTTMMTNQTPMLGTPAPPASQLENKLTQPIGSLLNLPGTRQGTVGPTVSK